VKNHKSEGGLWTDVLYHPSKGRRLRRLQSQAKKLRKRLVRVLNEMETTVQVIAEQEQQQTNTSRR
jgi:hypothetical protein